VNRRVVVVGGGITGLTTAWMLRHGPADGDPVRDDVDVVVLEASDRLGGKLHTVDLATATGEDLRVDVGADAFLARRPEATDLALRLGLADDLVTPQTGGVWLWLARGLRRLPEATVFGVPTDATAVARADVVSDRTLARVVAEPLTPRAPLVGDAPVAEVLAPRFGREVVDTLVEPLLGGVYAGSVDRLSVDVTVPMVAEAARADGPLTPGLQAHRRRTAGDTRPVFHTVAGGLGRMVAGLQHGLPAGAVRTGVRAVALEPAPAGGWRVVTDHGDVLDADAVVLATPADVTASLLADLAPDSVEALAQIPYASVAVVTCMWDRAAAAGVPEGSGMLVPRTAGRLVKASTWSSGKWPHLDLEDTFLARFSVGRVDDPAPLDLDDATLTRRVLAEAAEAMGVEAPPRTTRVTRWERGLPQYEVGHRARVAAVRAGLPGGLHTAGAAYDGVGIAPCIAQAATVAAALREG
jgi:protoporphyrinogen/coproporphyrinogen III oxidase